MRVRLLLTVIVWAMVFPVPNGALAADPPPARVADELPQPPGPKLTPEVEKILDELEERKIEDIVADLVFTKYNPIFDQKQVYEGTLLFRMDKPNPRFKIEFDKYTNDGVVSKQKEWHLFDGTFYVEAREKTRQIIRRQIVRPGEQVEVFKVGQGPFPLPFGQKKEEILRQFAIKLAPPDAKNDPENTDHLVLSPLPSSDLSRRYDLVHFHVDRKSHLPVRVHTVEKEDKKEITASFKDIRLNSGVAASRLNLPKEVSEPGGYSVIEERLGDKESPASPGGS